MIRIRLQASIKNKKGEIVEKTDREIDERVYESYGLMKEEIKIVEED